MKKLNAFSLVEIVISVGIFSLVATSVAVFALDSYRTSQIAGQRNTAAASMQELGNSLLGKKNDLWSNIIDNANTGTKHLVFSSGTYSIANGSVTTNGVTTGFVISDAFRDASGNIVTSGGTNDPHTKIVDITASWTGPFGQVNSITSKVIYNDWSTLKLTQTTVADFTAGTLNQTKINNISGGEVGLDQVLYPDWCKPTTAINTYDIPGSATAKAVFATQGHAFFGTAGNATGAALTKLNISGVNPPTIAVEGSYNGYLTNNIFISGNYAYLATTDFNKQVVIVNITSAPYTEVGYFDANTNFAGNSVVVSGNTAYVAVGKKVMAFDVSSKTGSRNKLGEITLVQNPNSGYQTTAKVSKIAVNGNYIFAALDQDLYEMAIANVTNPASMTLSGLTDVNDQQTTDIYVNSTGTRAYFGTNSSGQREFFIINTATKTGARPIIGSYDTNGMSILGLAVIEADKRAILVGNNAEEYQAVNINTEASPVRCGGMQLNNGINDVDSITDALGNAFSYIVTNNATQDFQIIRGGPGIGGGANGYGYFLNGDYTSPVYDTTSATARYFLVQWTATVPANTTLKMQMRSGTTANLSAVAWAGPDGTAATYFTTQPATNLPSVLQNKRYFQYKFFYTSDTFGTPDLQQVILTYQK